MKPPMIHEIRATHAAQLVVKMWKRKHFIYKVILSS